MRAGPGALAAALLAAALAAREAHAAPSGAPALLDAFESVDGWSARPADGVEMTLSTDAGVHGRALRVDFRFVKGGGYAVLHRDLALDLPENYRFTFRLRGECRPNNLEFKLVDSSGANVWWLNQRDYPFPRVWQSVRIKKRQIHFAWGPAGGGELRRAAAIELAVTAGSGGAGTIWLDDLELTTLPPPSAAPPPVLLSASSARPGHGARRAADGDTASSWQSNLADPRPWLTLDLQTSREYGGLVIDWAPGGHPGDYVVEASDDRVSWRTLREVRGGLRARDPLYLPESESRYVRVRATRLAHGRHVAMREIMLKPLEWSASREAFFSALAKEAPRGSFPRGMSGEQSYWTVLSVDGGLHKGLMSEDGAIETGKGAFSIEPFLRVDGRLLSWADVHAKPSLAEGVLPIPSVRWDAGDAELTVTACAFGPADSSSILATYGVSNHGERARRAILYLALRPFQVNPPPQFLNTPGGTAPIRELVAEGRRARVNGDRVVESLTVPSAFGAATFDQGDVVEALRAGRLPAAQHVRDPFQAASGAFSYDLELPAHGTREVDLVIPLRGAPGAESGPPAPTLVVDAATARWREELGALTLSLPDSAVARSVVAQIGWILASRAGPALQPGTRSYARTWIRDGALMSAALLRAGHPEVVREFIEWFAPYQYDDGKVPCCVDRRGSDPVPEHDSHGEFVYLVAEYVRFSGDTALARRMWPRVRRAAAYLDSLRAERRTAEWRAPGREQFFGILPPSISHEGYSAKPMHSYWDDLWALKGYGDAAWLAGMLGLEADRARLATTARSFGDDLEHSIVAAMAAHHIDYVPGCADLGDFDATSTTIALDPVDIRSTFPGGALERTFERYWRFFRDRRDGREPWEAFTPYEMRAIGAFVRLGWRERADSLLQFFMASQRPPGWRQWPEVVWHDERAPHFLGDLPHAWVASDFVRSVLDMLAYPTGRSIQLGAGVPERWVREGHGISVRGLGTPWGALSYDMRARGEGIEVRIEPGAAPPSGFQVRAPAVTSKWRATINGAPASLNSDGSLAVAKAPATIVLSP